MTVLQFAYDYLTQ